LTAVMEGRPISLGVIETNIPDGLIAFDQWVAWRYEPSAKGKRKLAEGLPLDEPKDWTKVPYQPNGFPASVTDMATWSGFDECLKAYLTKKFDGVGFVLTNDELNGDPFFAVDLDHCRDPLDETIEPWARKVIEHFGSYTEVSPSGTGIRIFGKGQLPGKGRKKGNIEVYDHARYMTVTGHAL